MTPLPDSNTQHPSSWTLIRDVALLQVKLLVDGARDLLLVPATLIAGVVSLAMSQDGKPGPQFYRLVGIGKQSERWINLFGAFDNAPPEVVEENHFGDTDMDHIVSRMESFVVDEYKRGGITAQAKDRIDKALDAMQRRRSERDESKQ
jgi:hypothetical protein